MVNVLSKKDIRNNSCTRVVLTEKSPFVVLYMPFGNFETINEIREKYTVQNYSFSKEDYEIVDGFYKGYLVKKVLCSKIQINDIK